MVLSHFKIESLVCDHKYRGASKEGHRGAIINIVAQQKMGFMCEIKSIVARPTMSSCWLREREC
jgi:hypothetical protein